MLLSLVLSTWLLQIVFVFVDLSDVDAASPVLEFFGLDNEKTRVLFLNSFLLPQVVVIVGVVQASVFYICIAWLCSSLRTGLTSFWKDDALLCVISEYYLA
jgi:hypothetical protein